MHLKLTNHRYLMIKNPSFFSQFITKMGFIVKFEFMSHACKGWWAVTGDRKSLTVDVNPLVCWSQDHWIWIDGEPGGVGFVWIWNGSNTGLPFFHSIQFVSKWPYPKSDHSTGNPLFTMTTSQRPCNWNLWIWWQHEPFPGETNIMLRPGTGKAWVAKRSWCLGMVPPNRCSQFSMISQEFGRNLPLTECRTLSPNHLFTLETAVHADHRVAIPILHVKYRTQFFLGVGWGGMYWAYVTLSCHTWKCNEFHYNDA